MMSVGSCLFGLRSESLQTGVVVVERWWDLGVVDGVVMNFIK